MIKQELDGIWNYYLSLERDILKTSNYVESLGQENVYLASDYCHKLVACAQDAELTDFEVTAK